MKRAVVALAILLLFNTSYAGEALEALKTSVQRVIDILNDKELKKDINKQKRRAFIRSAANEIFDYQEVSKRVLSRYWSKRTEEEKAEFVKLFSKLLEKTYISKIEDYSGEKIVYQKEIIRGQKALVYTAILTKDGREIPIVYRMIKKENGWKVYDVVIEGVSLVKNYRTQFVQILRKEPYEKLVQRLRKKVKG